VRSLGKIFLYASAVLLGGALAAPQTWHLIQAFPPDLMGGLIGEVQRMPFHRYLSRSLQVAAILLLLPLLRSLRIRSLSEFGLHRNDHALRDLATGVSAGLLCALLLQSVLLLTGAFGLSEVWSPSVLPRILMTAVAVAVIEEFLFRGVLLGFFRQFMTPAAALIFSSLIFSGVHFLNLPASGATAVIPCWWSGLAMLWAVGSTLPAWSLTAWAFATLFAAGILLGWLTIRTGSLWASVGLHGSWVFGQQLFNSAARFQASSPEAMLPLAGPSQCHGAVPVGVAPLLSLLCAAVLAFLLLSRRPRPTRHAIIRHGG
jgi:uncharacterized protein